MTRYRSTQSNAIRAKISGLANCLENNTPPLQRNPAFLRHR